MFRISQDGELKWFRQYTHDAVVDGLHYSTGWLNEALELPNGNIVATGVMEDTTYLETGELVRDFDVWVLQVDSNGCLEPGCTEQEQIYTATFDLPERGKVEYHVFPNPFDYELNINLSEDCRECRMRLYDLTGKEIVQGEKGLHQGKNQMLIHPGLISGLYVLAIEYQGQIIVSEKVYRR